MTIQELKQLKQEMAEARQDIIDMLLYVDRHETKYANKASDSACIVSKHIENIEITATQELLMNELKKTWAMFKHTRETELIPAIISGDTKAAKHLAAGVQKSRLDKMYAILSELENVN